MSEYKKCPNGHYYKGDQYDECPYCRKYISPEAPPSSSPSVPKQPSGSIITIGPRDDFYTTGYVAPPPRHDQEDPNLLSFGPNPSKDNKVCPNRHAYQGKSDLGCPYCGEWKVIGCADMNAGKRYSFNWQSANSMVDVEIDGKEYHLHDVKIGFWALDRKSRVKSGYMIDVGGDENVGITCHSEIQIGHTTMTGKDFIKMCDVIIDNQLTINPVNIQNEPYTRKVVGKLIHSDGEEFQLYDGRNFIGRDIDSNITVNDSMVSFKHAVIIFRSGKYSIIDQQSSYGTFVNGKDIDLDPCYLNDGDEIKIGQTIFLFKKQENV